MPFAGRGCHARGSTTLRYGCNCTRWPTTWQASCAASSCRRLGTRVLRHASDVTFQLAEVAVTGPVVRTTLAAMHHLQAPQSRA